MSAFCGVKGPKTILSSTIASALAKYFLVDEKLMESNLLEDTKIVLYNVLLRKQEWTLPPNSFGCSTVTVTGSVEEVAFTWVWSFSKTNSGSDGWVRDVALKIKGLRFKAMIEHVTAEEAEATKLQQSEENANEEGSSDTLTMEVEKEGGMTGYIRKQLEMIIDALTFYVVDFEFTVEMPPPRTEKGAPASTSLQDKGIAIVFGGKTFELVSLGRKEDKPPPKETWNRSRGDETSSSTVLKQRLTIGSFYANIVKIAASNDGVFEQGVSLMNPFSYCTEVTRHSGKRFRGMRSGLRVVGRPIGVEVEDGSGSYGIVLHAGKYQIQALTQLATMLFPPSDDREDDLERSVQPRIPGPDQDEFVTSFVLPISSVLVLRENTTVSFPDVIITCRADGTELSLDAERLLLESTSGDGSREGATSISVWGIKASMRPNVKIEMSAIETLDIPGVVRLTEPIRNTKMEMEGGTLSIKLERVEVTRLSSSKSSVQKNANGSKTKPPVSGKGTPAREDKESASIASSASIPFAVNVAVQDVRIKSSDGSNTLTQLREVDLHINPDEKTAGIHLALRLGELKNELLQIGEANLCALLPTNQLDEIHKFNFGAGSGVVTAGFSTKDWKRAFAPPEKRRSTKSQTMKLPYAQIAPLKLRIALAGTGLKVKETSIVTAPFAGKANTTLKDLVRFYAHACLSRTPEFLSNAEVLGLNVVDTFFGKAAPIGLLGGLAVGTAMETVKGAFAVRKMSRGSGKGKRSHGCDKKAGVSLWRKGATRADGIGREKEDGKAADFVAGMRARTVNFKHVADEEDIESPPVPTTCKSPDSSTPQPYWPSFCACCSQRD